MLPHYHTGDLVLVERRWSYHVGQVIAYRVPQGDPMAGAQVIHRIVGGDAQHGFVVQGDNRTVPDIWHPRPKDIVGAQLLRIPDALVVLRCLRAPLLLGLLASSFVLALVLGGRKDEEPELRVTMTLVELGAMGECDARTQRASIAPLSTRRRTPQRAAQHAQATQSLILTRAPGGA